MMKTPRDEVCRIIDEKWSQEIEFLQKLIAYRSILLHEAGIQNFLAYKMRAMGLKVDVFDVDLSKICNFNSFGIPEWGYQDRPQVVGVLPAEERGGKSLVLNGHIDVVPTGSAEEWSYDPWQGTIAGDRLYGRGSADMKAGVAAMIFAVEAIRAAGVKLAGDVILQTVTEEECTGNGALACLARGYVGDACLVPECFGQNALINSGGLLWLRTKVKGRPGHPLEGYRAVNAIEKAIYLINSLKILEISWNRNKHEAYIDYEQPINVTTGVIKGGAWPSMPADECIFETRIGFKPDLKITDAKVAILEHLGRAVERDPYLKDNPPDFSWYGLHVEGASVNKEDAIVQAIARAHRKITGKEITYSVTSGSADHRHWIKNCSIPATCYGPSGANMHGYDEYVDLPSVLETTKVIAECIMEWCGVKG